MKPNLFWNPCSPPQKALALHWQHPIKMSDTLAHDHYQTNWTIIPSFMFLHINDNGGSGRSRLKLSNMIPGLTERCNINLCLALTSTGCVHLSLYLTWKLIPNIYFINSCFMWISFELLREYLKMFQCKSKNWFNTSPTFPGLLSNNILQS